MVKKDSLIGAQKRPFAQSWRIPMARWIGQEWFFKKKPQLIFDQEILNYLKCFSHNDLKNWLSISVIQTLAHVRNLAVFIKEKPPILFFTNQLFKFCQTRINRFHENWNQFIFVQCSVFQTSLHQTLSSSLWLVFNHS